MQTDYHKKQMGHVVIGVSSAGLIIVGGLMVKTQFSPIALIISIVIAICLYFFHCLTIEIDDQHLTFFFAHGFLKKQISIAEIDKTEIVTNRWYYGWGIRRLPDGWLYNVSGLKAVEIRMKNGKKVRIGTGEPEKVKQILDNNQSSF